MTEIQTAPETELVSTFWITYKHYGKSQMSRIQNGTQEDADTMRTVLWLTHGVTDIKIEWER